MLVYSRVSQLAISINPYEKALGRKGIEPVNTQFLVSAFVVALEIASLLQYLTYMKVALQFIHSRSIEELQQIEALREVLVVERCNDASMPS